MADWGRIKSEYITTTDTSYRRLSEKYGISYQAICRRSKAERWGEQREQHMNKTVTKTIDRISEKQVDRATRLQSVADKLLDRVEALVETGDFVLMNSQSMKHISGVLKDLKDIQMIRSEADLREQEARIAKLRREADPDKGTEAPKLVVEGLPEEFKV